MVGGAKLQVVRSSTKHGVSFGVGLGIGGCVEGFSHGEFVEWLDGVDSCVGMEASGVGL